LFFIKIDSGLFGGITTRAGLKASYTPCAFINNYFS